jgi:hypothetical protein
MNKIFLLLLITLIALCFWGLVSGKLFFLGRIVRRQDEKLIFYFGIIIYLVIAMFSWLGTQNL